MPKLHPLLKYAQDNNLKSASELGEALKERLGMSVKAYTKNSLTLWNFDYSQINSPIFNEVSDSARGLVLNENLEIQALPFSRFYNYQEYVNKSPEYLNAFNDSKGVKILEKLDGSLIKVYYTDLGWVCGTRGVPFADLCDVQGFSTSEKSNLKSLTFQDLIDRTLKETHNKLIHEIMPNKYKDFTFLFELMTPENRIVSKYNKDRFVLLGIINNKTLVEVNFNDYLKIGAELNFELPEIHEFKTFEDALEKTEDLKELKEGFIILETGTSKRVKIKNRIYVEAHHLRTNGLMTVRKAYNTFYERHEILGYFPELKPWYDAVENSFVIFRENVIDIYYEALNNPEIETQKDFAIYINSKEINQQIKGAVLSLAKGINELSSKNSKTNSYDSIIQKIWDKMFPTNKIDYIISVTDVKELELNYLKGVNK